MPTPFIDNRVHELYKDYLRGISSPLNHFLVFSI